MRGARRIRAKVNAIRRENEKFSLVAEGITYTADRVILATGGLSYPKTGSDGSGYRLAEGLGHRITPLFPSLVP